MNLGSSSALNTTLLYPKGNIPGTYFCYKLSRTQGFVATGRIWSMPVSSDVIGNPNRYLPACGAMPSMHFPPSGVFVSGFPAQRLWVYFLCIMRAILLAYHFLDTTNCVFRTPFHFGNIFSNFMTKNYDVTSTGRIDFDLFPFESETLTVCRNVCNHLLSVETSVTTYCLSKRL
jgi:hypothetical protein